MPDCQIDGHCRAHRPAKNQDAAGLHALDARQPIIGCVRGGVTAVFARGAAAAAITRIIEDENGESVPMPGVDFIWPQFETEISSTTMADKNRAVGVSA